MARWQATWVANQLESTGSPTELVPIKTLGDVTSGPIGRVGRQGVFTKEIQRALLEGKIDVAVHSLKDLPTEPVEGLALAAVPPREDAGDALVASLAASLEDLPDAARVGSGSARRCAQLLAFRPDCLVADIRGNVDTRLSRLDHGEFDAIILAEAGLRRLGLEQRITQVIPKEVMLPAVGQGALGLETRAEDAQTRQMLVPLDDPTAHQAVLAERAMLATIRGGCLAPVGAWARLDESGQLRLDAIVLSLDGTRRVTASAVGSAEAGEELGFAVAQQLIDQGAADLLADARASG